MEKLRILFSCTGVGVMNRGIESFFREAFEGLRNLEGVESHLVTGKGARLADEAPAFCLSRFSPVAKTIGKVTSRSSYAIEQLSSLPSLIVLIKQFRPHVIFSSEANLFFGLKRFRAFSGQSYKLLFSNGGPCNGPFHWADLVQQVSPFYLDQALERGEDPDKHRMVPYGISIPEKKGPLSHLERDILKRNLGLPTDRRVLLSVGWINDSHKRMDYTIREVAALNPADRPFLVLLGNIGPESRSILDLASSVLVPSDYQILSVPYNKVNDYYQAADMFVLSSLKEGFGRVFLEAMLAGLPIVAHRHPVMEYVIGGEGTLTDLSIEGALQKILQKGIPGRNEAAPAYVNNKFSWGVLRPKYRKMFFTAAKISSPHLTF